MRKRKKKISRRKVAKRSLKRPAKKGIQVVERKLTHDEKLQLIKWCVELRSNYEIADLIKKNFHKTLNPSMVWKYRHSKKWRPVIARLRAAFERNILKIPIANKADRLRILQDVVREGLTWSLKGYSKDGDKIYELKLGAVTEAVKAAKDETEPRRVEHSGTVTHEHFLKEAIRKSYDLPEMPERQIATTN